MLFPIADCQLPIESEVEVLLLLAVAHLETDHDRRPPIGNRQSAIGNDFTRT